MKPTLRRLSALAGLTTATAVVAGLVVAPSASAAITRITPNTAFNSESGKVVVYDFDGSGNYTLGGRSGTFVRLGAPSDSFTVDVRPTVPPSSNKAQSTIDFTDRGDGVFVDGPVNAGTYNVTTVANDTAGTTDTCTSCFTVQPAGPLALTSLSPNAVRSGESGQVTLNGNNFERGTRIDLLLPGTDTVDGGIQANLAPTGSGDDITTRTTLRRTVTIAAGTATGARDVRLTNVDGSTVTLARAFSVNGAPLSSTTPTAGNNAPSATEPTRVVFNGTGLSAEGVPFLQYDQDPGSSTREELTLRGTVVGTPTSTQITADFDLRNAAPQSYLPVVRNPDGSFNACSCRFTVAQSPERVTTVSSVDSDTATAGTDKSQQAGTTKTFVVTGNGFAKGSRVTVSGTGVTTTAVEFVSPTALKATFQSTSSAAAGNRDVTVTRTDAPATGSSGTCSGCYTVTAAPSPSASPTATTSPTASPSPDNEVPKPTVAVNPSTIVAVEEKSTVSGTAQPGSRIEIYAYSRPNTDYRLVRSATVGANGRYAFEVGPSGNTRLYARTVTPMGSADSDSIVLTVKTSLNLKVARTGTRTYRFTGSLLPKRPNQLITVFYTGNDGKRVIAARARNAADGTYNVTRQFTGTGTFTFFTGTGTDNNNAANNSNSVRVTIR